MLTLQIHKYNKTIKTWVENWLKRVWRNNTLAESQI